MDGMRVTGIKSEIDGNEKEWKGGAVVATTLSREHFYEVSKAAMMCHMVM